MLNCEARLSRDFRFARVDGARRVRSDGAQCGHAPSASEGSLRLRLPGQAPCLLKRNAAWGVARYGKGQPRPVPLRRVGF